MIKKLDLHVRKPNTSGVFHDTRADVATMIVCINRISSKIDEIIEILNSTNKN